MRLPGRTHVVGAQSEARLAMGATSRAAQDVERAIRYLPEHAERLHEIEARLWAMNEAVRDVERDLAEIHATLRVPV